MENENDERAQPNRFRAIIFRAVNFAQQHLFFVNFIVFNAVCLVAVQFCLEDRTTAEIIAIYNAMMVGCALLSQFVTRGVLARDHEVQPTRRRREKPDSPSGVFEEEDDEGAGNVELPLPEVLNRQDNHDRDNNQDDYDQAIEVPPLMEVNELNNERRAPQILDDEPKIKQDAHHILQEGEIRIERDAHRLVDGDERQNDIHRGSGDDDEKTKEKAIPKANGDKTESASRAVCGKEVKTEYNDLGEDEVIEC